MSGVTSTVMLLEMLLAFQAAEYDASSTVSAFDRPDTPYEFKDHPTMTHSFPTFQLCKPAEANDEHGVAQQVIMFQAYTHIHPSMAPFNLSQPLRCTCLARASASGATPVGGRLWPSRTGGWGTLHEPAALLRGAGAAVPLGLRSLRRRDRRARVPAAPRGRAALSASRRAPWYTCRQDASLPSRKDPGHASSQPQAMSIVIAAKSKALAGLIMLRRDTATAAD